MRYLIAFWLCLILNLSPVWSAEVRYVTDIRQITMRTGQGLDHKIVAMIKSGEKIEVLNEDGQWTMVKLDDGKEGWVLSRFLTETKPIRIILKELELKNEVLSNRNASLTTENRTLKEQIKQITTDLSEKEKNLEKHKTDYEALKAESTDFLKLKANYKSSAKRQIELEKKTHKMEERLNYLQTQHIFKWFLSGGGVLLLGFLIGFSSRRSRRRSSLL